MRPLSVLCSEPVSLVVDREGVIRSVSPGHMGWLRAGRHRLLGHPWWELIHPNDRQQVVQRVRSMQRGQEKPGGWRMRVRSGSGTWRWIQMTARRQPGGFIRLSLSQMDVAG